jgi:adenine phosphoribosyltransferase
MTTDDLKEFIRDVPDFPSPGIVFKDITPLLADPQAFSKSVDWLAETLEAAGAREILAIESRGFIFGAAVSARMSVPLQLVRKSGKLPGATVGLDYELEYGTDRIEIHSGVLNSKTPYGIVDDLIATGGTALATLNLVKQHDANIACCAFLIELAFLGGREKLGGCPVESLLRYD